MRRMPYDSQTLAIGSRAWFQALLDGGPQRTSADQAWDTAAQRVRSWLGKRGQDVQSLRSRLERRGSASNPGGSPRSHRINPQPWLTAPRWKFNRAFRRLPRGYREVFEMHERLGYAHRDIADHFGCSVGTSKSQLHKARRRIRQLLTESARVKSRKHEA